jgi:hypothetical protein
MYSILLLRLLAVLVPVSLVGGALAQVQENVPPTLSSGLPDAHANALTEKPGQLSAAQPVSDAVGLPLLDAIGAATDIRPFLEPGVPQDSARAALRRAWTADPAIRDFIGLSENSEDFNASEPVRVTQETENRPLTGSDKSTMGQLPSGR